MKKEIGKITFNKKFMESNSLNEDDLSKLLKIEKEHIIFYNELYYIEYKNIKDKRVIENFSNNLKCYKK